MEEILTFEEIAAVCRQAAKAGISKIKVTGGEPLVREGCTELIKMLKAIPGIAQVTLTTNGVLLPKYGAELYENGLDAVNISLDTLDRAKYKRITGFDQLPQVLEGIRKMEQYGIPVKINSVLSNSGAQGWRELIELARDRRLDVRFIEMMPIGYGKNYEPVSNKQVLKGIRSEFQGVCQEFQSHGNGPAVYYKIPGFLGSVGFISAVHGKFCGTCNRIRLTATGQLKPCLCYEEAVSLKNAVRNGYEAELEALIQKAVLRKPKGHCFEEWDRITETCEMAKIGG